MQHTVVPWWQDPDAPQYGESTGINFDAYEDIPVETSGGARGPADAACLVT
jgi:hypothetical protein